MRKLFKNKKIILAAGAILVVAAALLFWLLRDSPAIEPEPAQPTYSQLTGIEVAPEVAERPVLGIMIENSVPARPQTGLDAAGIVFESVTEGGITRYLALYQEDIPEVVGPVRSLRPHFLDWAMGFDVSIAHVGGSPEALQRAEDRDAKSLSQFTFSDPYYRVSNRTSPHNMYTRTADLRSLQEEQNHDTSAFDEIPRKDDNPAENPAAATIAVDYAGDSYKVEFRYSAEMNSYIRYLAGSPHIDAATDKPITVKNVIIIKTPQQATGTNAIGNGEALVFTDGNVRTVRWEKDNFESRIKFVNDEGAEISLNRGDSWVSALPSNRSVNY